MADTRVSDLAVSLTTPVFADLFYVVDVSEILAADRSKKVTLGDFLTNTVLTGLTPAAGTVSATDGIFGAIQKLASLNNNLTNFRDTASNADASISINSGATQIIRAIGSTTFVELSTSRIQRNVTNSSLGLLGGLAKGSGAFVEVFGDTAATVGLVQIVTKGVGSGEGNFQIYNNAVGSSSGDLRASMANDGSWTMTPAWNSGGTTFTGWRMNVTDTASAAASLLLALQVSSTSLFSVAKTGATRIIGTSAATSLLHCSTDTTATGLAIFEQASADADPFDLSFRKTRGTVASPTVITTGDCLGNIIFRGYSGAAGYVTGAAIRGDSTGTIATTRVGANLVFSTGTDAAPTVLTDAMTITSSQQMGLGTLTPGGLFHAASNVTAQLSILEQASADGTAFTRLFRKTRGTVASPSAITSGDTLGTVSFAGYSGAAGYVTSASIRAVSSGTIATTRVASSLVFATATDAAPSVLTDWMSLNSTGTLLFTFATGTSPIGPALLLGSDTNARLVLGLTSTDLPYIGFGSGSAVRDLFIRRDGAGILALSNVNAAAQTFRITETTDTGLTNYSRLSFQTQAGNHLIRTEAAGTGLSSGQPRILQVGTGPSVGTNIAGQNTIVHGGQGTGSGAAGAILFQQSLPVGGSGSGVTALATTAQFDTAGRFTTTSTSYAPLSGTRDAGSGSSGSFGAFAVIAKTTQSTVSDGFGPSFDLNVLLNATTYQYATLRGNRRGADNSSDLHLNVYSAGVEVTSLIIKNNISVAFGGITNSFNAIARDAVNGFTLQSAAATATYNDASTAGSGTVANRYLFGLAAPTLTSTNATVTYTVASSLYIGGAPTASTNVTITDAFAILIGAGNLGLTNANNIVLGTVTGTRIGTATSQKLAFWNKTPIVQPTTGITAAAFVANTSLIADDSATFGGYTLGQIAAALINSGLLA